MNIKLTGEVKENCVTGWFSVGVVETLQQS
jgi:hypothetical protein